MLAGNAAGAYQQGAGVTEDKAIREKYSQAGLYRNDGSTTPLWTVDWYAFSVDVSSNGTSLIEYNRLVPQGSYGAPALTFYEKGQKIKGYRVDQLVRDPTTLPRTVSSYMWLKSSSFMDKEDRLAIETNNGETYLFDVTTGNVVSDKLQRGIPTIPPVGGGWTAWSQVKAPWLVGLVLGPTNIPLLFAALMLGILGIR